jgi:hypothetical protein
VSLITVVERRYIASKTLAAWVKRKWMCSEESSPEAGVQARIKYIMAKHKTGSPSARNANGFEDESSSTIYITIVYIYCSTQSNITFENASNSAPTEREVSHVGYKHGCAEPCTAIGGNA